MAEPGHYILMPVEMIERLRRQAATDDRSVSCIVRRAITEKWARDDEGGES